MSNYRQGSHSVFSIHVHLVWITKYRKKILSGDIAQRARSLIRAICEKHQVEILKGHIAPDHIHLFVSLPPNIAVSKLMQQLKGRTSHAMINEFALLRRQYWGRHMWARGYFCCSSGNVTDEIIKQYIAQQEEADDTFRIEGEWLQPASAGPIPALAGNGLSSFTRFDPSYFSGILYYSGVNSPCHSPFSREHNDSNANLEP